jgi:phosphatidylserine/phosphatidylglycerophosphate/cardiolipin synthase-like enzyme
MYTNTYHRHAKTRERGRVATTSTSPADNILFNELTFYPAFGKDLASAKREVIIYSPFVSKYRAETVCGHIAKLTSRNIDVFIFTRPVEEYERRLQTQVQLVHRRFEEVGAYLYCLHGTIHEKVAIIDREILWEGSLNILSQRESREMMRRSANEALAGQVLRYLRLEYKLADGYKQKYERLYRDLMGAKSKSKAGAFMFILGAIMVSVSLLAILNAESRSGVITGIELLKWFSPK